MLIPMMNGSFAFRSKMQPSMIRGLVATVRRHSINVPAVHLTSTSPHEAPEGHMSVHDNGIDAVMWPSVSCHTAAAHNLLPAAVYCPPHGRAWGTYLGASTAPSPASSCSADGQADIVDGGLIAVQEGHAHGGHSSGQGQDGRHDSPDTVACNQGGGDDGSKATGFNLADPAVGGQDAGADDHVYHEVGALHRSTL